MKLRMPKRPLHLPGAIATATHYCERIDHMLPRLRTLLLIAGVLGAALKGGMLADYLFVSGMLLHGAIWFQGWWHKGWRH